MINKSSKRYERGKEEIKLFLSFMDNKSEDKNDEYKKKKKKLLPLLSTFRRIVNKINADKTIFIFDKQFSK